MATYTDANQEVPRQTTKLEALHDFARDITSYARRVRENLVEVNARLTGSEPPTPQAGEQCSPTAPGILHEFEHTLTELEKLVSGIDDEVNTLRTKV
jgi:hypothetical protein